MKSFCYVRLIGGLLAAFAAGVGWHRLEERTSPAVAEARGHEVTRDEQKSVLDAEGSLMAEAAPPLPAYWLKKEASLSDPSHRARAIAQGRAYFRQQRQLVKAWSREKGVAWRTAQAGRVRQLQGLRDGRPMFRITRNVNAAISAGVWPLWQAPYELDGAGQTVGVWDAGTVRVTHAELLGRVINEEDAELDWHATHVTGTIAATGVAAAAQGMAPLVRVEAHDWDDDYIEMTARGAAYPGEDDKLLLSNHSYGFSAGWQETGENGRVWVWDGDTSAEKHDPAFGRYSEESQLSDTVAYALPYYLIIRAAGNDREDNPRAGDKVRLNPESHQTTLYNPALHPSGDGKYRDGYDTLSYDELAKNVISVGSVSDAIQGMRRSVVAAKVSAFSSWGPTDDGRVKPDVVANGEGVYSTGSARDDDYRSENGTSMASASVAGTLSLLTEVYERARPGQALRASTLKGLLLHTADDLATPGPDYQTGWGLINARVAVEFLQRHLTMPSVPMVLEDEVTSASDERSYPIQWNGEGPLQVTLVWTDPPGEVAEVGDDRTPRLVHDLDLTLVGPDGQEYLPYVMPWVGDWSQAVLMAAALRGKNRTDNVEQVLIAEPPPMAGVYTAKVKVEGELKENRQVFSLIVSGAAAPATASSLQLASVSPTEAAHGVVLLELAGQGFQLGATVSLHQEGESEVRAFGCEVLSQRLLCRVGVDGLAAGWWDVRVTNPDGNKVELPKAFQVRGAIWGDNFEAGASGWTVRTPQGNATPWKLAEERHHSGRSAFSVTEPTEPSLVEVESPPIAVPEDAENLTLRFWHAYRLPESHSGGVLELSFDDGETWIDASASESGLEMQENGYTAIAGEGAVGAANPLAGRRCWAGEARDFHEVVLPVVDPARFRGRLIRLRWRLGWGQPKGATTSRTGFWHLDDVALTGQVSSTNEAPVITEGATAQPPTVTGTSAILHVQAMDGDKTAGLVYTWSSDAESLPAVVFEPNASPEAGTTQATFAGPGDYPLRVTVSDDEGLSASSSVTVSVEQTAAGLRVWPHLKQLPAAVWQTFAAQVLDQFGDVLETLSPKAEVTWTGTGGVWQNNSRFLPEADSESFSLTAAYGEWSDKIEGVVIGRSFEAWQTVWFGTPPSEEAGELDDPDGDALPNLLEFALGADPRSPTTHPSARMEDGQLTLTFSRPQNLPGLTYVVEASADLETWDEVATEVTLTEGEEWVRARVPTTADVAQLEARFLRLRVERVVPPKP